jgi:hypothetical protein
MAHLDDGNHELLVLDRVDDAIVPLSDTVLVSARELLAAGWARLIGEVLDATDDASPLGDAVDGFDLFDGGRLDEEAISCHAS